MGALVFGVWRMGSWMAVGFGGRVCSWPPPAFTVLCIKFLVVWACATALALASVMVQGEVWKAVVVGALTITSVWVQLLWFSTRSGWASACTCLWINNQIPRAFDVFWALTATGEDVEYLMVISLAFIVSSIPDIFRCPSCTYTLTQCMIKGITS